MSIYKYKAIGADKKTISGLVEAVSEDDAALILRDKEMIIISLEKEAEKIRSSASVAFGWVSNKDIVIFSRQFSVMVSANVTIVQALKILIDQTVNVKLKSIISDIAFEVDAGSKLSDALAKRPKIFSNFYISVVRSGETSGRLDESLNYLADEMEKDYDMISKIRGAMIYPAFVFFGLGAVGVVMMVYVIPKLTSVLTESGAELPVATRILIAVSNFLANWWFIILFVLIGLAAGLYYALKNPFARAILDSFVLRVPVFGKLLQRIYLVRFSRSLNTLIIGGVSLTEGLKIAGEVVGNHVYKKLIEETVKEVEDGNSISSIFIKSKEVPKMVSQMMSIGEKTGKLDLVLERITDFYTREITNIIANLMTMMEPFIMIVMGVAVGIMVAAVILPMYNMAGQM